MKRFAVALTMALESVRDRRTRSVLSAMGVAVAAVAIVTLVSIALGVQKDISRQVEDLGVNTLIVLPGRFQPGQFNPNIGGQSYLKESDGESLRGVEGVKTVAPLTFVGGGVNYDGRDAYPLLVATTSSWFQMHPEKLRAGSLWTDPRTTERVTVIGSVAADDLFGKGNSAIGQTILVNNLPYKVVGVTQDQSAEPSLFSMFALQNVVYIPYHAAKQAEPTMQTHRLMVQCAPDAEPKALVARLETKLAARLTHEQFSVLTQEDLLKLVYRLMRILTWLLVGLTSIGMFVGGVGIMTLMLMSVGERSHEIGLRKALGARQSDIFWQFFAESVVLSILGGLAGLAFSAVVCEILRRQTDIKPLLTFGVVGLCFGTCLGVGAIFGLIPAMQAARRDPVAAMRRE